MPTFSALHMLSSSKAGTIGQEPDNVQKSQEWSWFFFPPEKSYLTIQEGPIWHDEKGLNAVFKLLCHVRELNCQAEVFVPIFSWHCLVASDWLLTSSLLILGVFLIYLHSDSAYSEDSTYTLFLTAPKIFKTCIASRNNCCLFCL